MSDVAVMSEDNDMGALMKGFSHIVERATRYPQLQKEFDDFKTEVNRQVEGLKAEIEGLKHQIDDLTNRNAALSESLAKVTQERNDAFRREAELSEKLRVAEARIVTQEHDLSAKAETIDRHLDTIRNEREMHANRVQELERDRDQKDLTIMELEDEAKRLKDLVGKVIDFQQNWGKEANRELYPAHTETQESITAPEVAEDRPYEGYRPLPWQQSA